MDNSLPTPSLILNLEVKMTKDEMLKRIKELEKAKKELKGTPCEVYSRVVGYLRPTQQWNDGKQEEFKQRKTFKVV